MLTSNASVLRRAPPRLLIVGGLHVVVLWALMNGLNIHPLVTHHPEDIQWSVIDEVPPPVDKPPKLEPHISEMKFTAPVVKVVLPPVDIEAPPPVITLPPPVIDTLPRGSAEPPAVVTGVSVDPRHPLSQPPYPMEARHFGEEGRVLLSILVGVDGRVLDAKVTQSSGSERLDQAASKEARQHWRLLAARRNGAAFEQWITVPVVFRLETR